MTALSLFSGIGGLDLSADLAGIKTVAMCEIDPFCRRVLRKHWPNVQIFEDIKKLRGEDIGSPVDIIHGGPPCQPVSVAGRRRGQDDKRYLWGEVFRLVADLMPRFLVLENVPGILTIAADDICKSLVGLGYSVGICCFEAAAVGAPHRRARVFFVGHSERGGLQRKSWRRAREKPSDGRSDIPDSACGGRHEPSVTRSREHQESQRATGGCDRIFPDPDSQRQLQQSGKLCEFGERTCDSGQIITDPESNRCGSRRAESKVFCGESGVINGSRRQPESRLGRVVDGLPGWMDGRSVWGKEPDVPRVARGVENRVNRLRALGNAVVPPQVYPIFRAIMEEFERGEYK